jgi:hypothetical protein
MGWAQVKFTGLFWLLRPITCPAPDYAFNHYLHYLP